MNTLFDLLNTAQNGHAIDNLARHFELSQQQALAAAQALMPAFSLGLKRQVEQAKTASEPPDFFGLSGAPQVDSFQDAALAFTQQATQQGQSVMAALFGAPEMTRALSQLAALQSGVAAPVISAMLPSLASILVSGLARAGAPSAPSHPLGEMMEAMMRAFQPPKAKPAPWFDNSTLAALWAPFLAPLTAPPTQSTPADVMGQMLEAGNQIQKAQVEAMQTLFESWFGKK
ncbi:DUF937 domain-containing protein [Labrys neptuniae]